MRGEIMSNNDQSARQPHSEFVTPLGKQQVAHYSHSLHRDMANILSASLRSDQFRKEREEDWAYLENLVEKLEAGRKKQLSDDDIEALPVLYRKAVSSLSVARETSLDNDVVRYLKSLCLRSYYVIYGAKKEFIPWLKGFFTVEAGRTFRQLKWEIWAMFLLLIASVIAGYFAVNANPNNYYTVASPPPFEVRVPGASHEQLYDTIFDEKPESGGLTLFFSQLFGNNSMVSVLAYALGFLAGIPSILLLIANMLPLGGMIWVFDSQGLGIDFLGWLFIHGTSELFAIILACAAGVHIGRCLIFPGEQKRLVAMQAAGRRGALMMIVVFLMLFAAGLLEGFGRQLINVTWIRFAIGAAMLCLWLAWLLFTGRGERHNG